MSGVWRSMAGAFFGRWRMDWMADAMDAFTAFTSALSTWAITNTTILGFWAIPATIYFAVRVAVYFLDYMTGGRGDE